MRLPIRTLIALLPHFLQAQSQASGSGTTTRYWDCCKPSCAWPGKATLLSGSSPVTTCDISNNPLTDANAVSGCDSGTAYQCSNESPWAINDELAYGYAAVNIEGGSEASWCCACYELTFTSGAVAGKKMIVQATNTGGDLAGNQFDISIPGGGVGIFNGCTTEWGAPSSGWGAQYGGITSRSDCDSFPAALQDGCYWRFDWFEGADNPTVSYTQVACPVAITANTNCIRADDSNMPAVAAIDSASSSLVSSSTVAAPTVSTSIALEATSATSSPVTTSLGSAVAGVEGSSTQPASSAPTPKPDTTSASAVTPSSSVDATADDVCEL